MKFAAISNGKRGFTKGELWIVMAVVGVLVALLLPTLAKSRARSSRISCVCCLKQIGLALRMWSNECGEKFPWQVTTNRNGSAEWLGPNDTFRHFLVVSNELTTPKVLVCPSDRSRTRSSRWEGFTSNRHLSYFIGLDADETRPQTILSGDRSISTNGQFLTGLVRLKTNSPVQWADGIHGAGGNVAHGDGSAQQLIRSGLARQLMADTNESIRLLIP